MNEIQEKILNLSKQRDISELGLRELGRVLGVKHPQTIKYHLGKLHQAGLLSFNMKSAVKIDKDLIGDSSLISIPIRGMVSAGPATQIASNDINGFLKVSTALLHGTRNYKELYALRVTGTSMNRSNVNGEHVYDGDFAIIDSSKKSPKNGDYVIAVVDDLANLKKFHKDDENNQIVLMSESSDDYSPIFVHPEDSHDGLIGGTVVQVVHAPRTNRK